MKDVDGLVIRHASPLNKLPAFCLALDTVCNSRKDDGEAQYSRGGQLVGIYEGREEDGEDDSCIHADSKDNRAECLNSLKNEQLPDRGREREHDKVDVPARG